MQLAELMECTHRLPCSWSAIQCLQDEARITGLQVQGLTTVLLETQLLCYADTGLLTVGLESLLGLCLHMSLNKLPDTPRLSLHIHLSP